LFLGGYLGDRIMRTNGRMIVASVAIALSIPFLYYGLAQPVGNWMAVSLLMSAGCMMLYLYYSTVYSSIQDVIEPSLRGTAMALYFFAMYILGGALGPVGLGAISDYFAKKAAREGGIALEGLAGSELATALGPYASQGLHSALFVVPIICGALALVLAAGARTVTADAENLRKWFRESATDVS
jgi:MFS family permease